jgi:hypothetical protein
MTAEIVVQITAFVHGHDKSWHSNIIEDLSHLNWDAVVSYLPLSRKYFYNYGSYFWLFPSNPEQHLETPVATGAEAQNGSFPQHEVPLPRLSICPLLPTFRSTAHFLQRYRRLLRQGVST